MKFHKEPERKKNEIKNKERFKQKRKERRESKKHTRKFYLMEETEKKENKRTLNKRR